MLSSSSSSPSPMDATAGKNHEKRAKKMSRGGGGGGGGGGKQQQEKLHSFWGVMALKNRSQPGGGGAESKNSNSSSKMKKRSSISISRSMTCAGSICSTKESSVLSRGSRRSSTGGGGRNTSSSRSLKAPDNYGAVSASASVPASGAAVSASSSFNSETTVATSATATTIDSSSSSALSSPLSALGGSTSRSFRKLSGCYYECHSAAALDPRTSLGAAAALLPCADCDEVFMNAGSLELHRSTRHAVSELGADDTSRNVVEIIFQSSWLVRKLPAPVCGVERVLKVRSSGKTVERFEQYRERIKACAASSSGEEMARRSYPRCAADGNELLRFHCTTFRCSLGLAGATALCRTSPSSPQQCKLCSIIRDGFSVDGDGKIATMATSGGAHDMAARVSPDGGEKRAMLVCRVVAGRVKKVVNGSNSSEELGCDSVSSCSEGAYTDLDELFVFNPRAILPCFVVIYSGY